MSSPREAGRKAETSALHHLQREGLRLIERNYTTRYGEIDLIMRDGGAAVFVEVRMRSSGAYGSAVETIDRNKCRRLMMAASTWLQENKHCGDCRFDVVAMDRGRPPHWVRNAFEFDGDL